jgi:hypothetical protein
MELKLNRLLLNLALVVLISLISGLFPTSWAEESGWGAVGFRAGIDDGDNDEDFEQYEGFVLYDLPWSWSFVPDWTLGTYLELNAGVLDGGGDAAFIGSIGPGLILKAFDNRLAVSGGINPTYVSEDTFGDEDFGGSFQFTSHIGISFRPIRPFSIGYRFQHMSNAGIYSENPGLNLHMLELAYYF